MVQGKAEFAARRDGEPKVLGKGSQRPGFRWRIAARWRCLCSRSVSRNNYPHLVTWFEIPAAELDRAAKFYSDVLGVSTKVE